LRFITWTGKRI